MRAHYSWGGGWGAVNLKISCYVLRCHQWSGSGKKTAKKGTNIQSEDTSTSRNNKGVIVSMGVNRTGFLKRAGQPSKGLEMQLVKKVPSI